MHSQDRAELGDLRIVTYVWGDGSYQAHLLAPVPETPSCWAPIEHLTDYEPETLRAFAKALSDVADEIEHQRTPDSGDNW